MVGEDAWPRAGARGFRAPFAAGIGSGLVRSVTAPNEFMMATNYAAGWNPNSVGSPSPMIGPPIGRNLLDGKDLGFDCLSCCNSKPLGATPHTGMAEFSTGNAREGFRILCICAPIE